MFSVNGPYTEHMFWNLIQFCTLFKCLKWNFKWHETYVNLTLLSYCLRVNPLPCCCWRFVVAVGNRVLIHSQSTSVLFLSPLGQYLPSPGDASRVHKSYKNMKSRATRWLTYSDAQLLTMLWNGAAWFNKYLLDVTFSHPYSDSSSSYFTNAMEVDTPTNNYQRLRCKRSLNDCQLPTNVSWSFCNAGVYLCHVCFVEKSKVFNMLLKPGRIT